MTASPPIHRNGSTLVVSATTPTTLERDHKPAAPGQESTKNRAPANQPNHEALGAGTAA